MKNTTERNKYLRSYYQLHREELIEKNLAYQKSHPTQSIANAKKWYLANHGQAMEIRAKWREKNPDYFKHYYQQNREKVLQKCKEWQADNPGKVKLYRKVTKLRRRAVGFITKDILQRIYEDNIKQYGTLTCYLCGEPIKFGEDSIDHKKPISKGGNNDYCNLAVAHLLCNKRKGTSDTNNQNSI